MNFEQIKNNIPSEDELDSVSSLFKILGDATRCQILFILSQESLCVGDICACMNMNVSAISHQLRLLKQAKLVKNKKIGKEVFYSLDDDHVSEIFNCALVHIRE